MKIFHYYTISFFALLLSLPLAFAANEGNGPPFTPPGPPQFDNGNGNGPPFTPPYVVVSPEGPKPKNNIGHGNNLDGVDVSNPGKSKVGEDSDPSIDDERAFYLPLELIYP